MTLTPAQQARLVALRAKRARHLALAEQSASLLVFRAHIAAATRCDAQIRAIYRGGPDAPARRAQRQAWHKRSTPMA